MLLLDCKSTVIDRINMPLWDHMPGLLVATCISVALLKYNSISTVIMLEVLL